jgi:uncharacterized membrane protein
MADYVVEYHPLFALVKDGERPVTSRRLGPAGTLGVELELGPVATEVRLGEPFTVRFTAHNSGSATWLAGPLAGGGHVTAGAKLLRPSGRLVEDHIGRTQIPHDVAPGQTLELEAEFRVPEDVEPGDYRVEFDMVAEWIRWFGDAVDGEPRTWSLKVL